MNVHLVLKKLVYFEGTIKKSEYSVYQIDGAELLIPFKSSVHQYAGWDINKGRNRERITDKE
jgi:hypothetical protein